MREIELFGTRMHPLTVDETVRRIDDRLSARRFTQHVVVNVAKLVHAQRDDELRKSVNDCDIINIDGMGIVWGARLLGHSVPERVAGVDLFESLVGLAARQAYPIFLLGATDEIVSSTAQILKTRHPAVKIAGYHHGYFWDDERAVVDKIAASGARLLFVAITSPKKENFINRWRDRLGVDFVMGVGGTFDVIAGKVRRAPIWMQRRGLEWLYRVYQEPRRMWWRYASTNSRFALMLIRALVGARSTRVAK